MERLVNMPEAQAKAILLALCSDNLQLRDRTREFLDQIESLEHPTTAGSHPRGTKRKARSSIKICVQCQSPFYEEDNIGKVCIYHNGELEADYDADAWIDHDERCHGTIDSDENRDERPEGFNWNCCGKPGHRGGCTRGKHDALSNQRGRYGDIVKTTRYRKEEGSSESEQFSQREYDSESDSD
ncbi:hypothetical protein F4859DRAFT_478747 [Xylaria cf. heliscus]|nr:hypothetical protein F4859DRAFT_478747 [Xylaria cf. heliscus]